MPGPTAYVPTSKNIAKYYRPFFKVSKTQDGKIRKTGPNEAYNYGKNLGLTYTVSFTNLPINRIAGDPEFYSGIQYSKNTWESIEYFKLVGEGLRASQPFMFNGGIGYFFNEDMLGSTYQTTAYFTSVYTNQWGAITGKTGIAPNPWGYTGITVINETWRRICTAIQSAGLTIDYVMVDKEGTPFDAFDIATRQADLRTVIAIVNNSQYSQPWQGISSWQYYFEGAGGSTLFSASNNSWFGIGACNYIPWDNAQSKYVGKFHTLAHYNPIAEYFPDVTVSNYGWSVFDGFTAEKTGKYFSDYWANIGNASSTVNYTSSSGVDIENNATQYIYEENPYQALQSKRTYGKDIGIVQSPRFSFLKSLQIQRETKRNSPNLAHHPWISSVNGWGVGTPTTVWTIGDTDQSDANVLANSWNKENLTITRGETAPDGTTGAFTIRSSQTNGICFYLDYFLYGTTIGATYTFSYHINLDKGFTASFFKLQNWKTYLSTDSISSGLTFTQISPVSAGPFLKEKLVGFTTGNSGWTKVTFQFQGTTNPYVAISNFYARNASSSGYTSYVWNPSLEIEYPSGVTNSLSIPAYDSLRYEVSDVCPPIGFSDMQKGYNPKSDIYFTRRGGNSGYYYEWMRHTVLMGSNAIGYYNPDIYTDFSLPNARRLLPSTNYDDWISPAVEDYFNLGGTIGDQRLKQFDECLHDINTRLGGYTATTAFTGWMDWLGSYSINGAPVKGNTSWLWRVTSLPGYTVYCNGDTLSSYGKIGKWVTTPSSSLSGITITSSKWPLPSEPTLGVTYQPTKDFNFIGMTTTSQLISLGFTFARGSTASFINEQGKVSFVSANQARFSYDPNTLNPKGLMLEPPATNLLNWSESFATSGGSNNNWLDTNILRSSGHTSPSDSLNAIMFTATGANATLLASATSGVTNYKAFSFWMKGITGNENAYYTFDDGSSWNYIDSLTTSWKRFEYGPFIPDGKVGFKIGNTGNSIFIWGAQLEQRLDPTFNNWLDPGKTAAWVDYNMISTSYIRSEATRGTRSADYCAMRGTSFTSWFGNTYGTIVYEASLSPRDMWTVTNLSFNNLWYYFALRPEVTRPILESYYQYSTYNGLSTDGRTAWSNDLTASFSVFYPYRNVTRDTPYKFGISYEPRKFTLTGNLGINSAVNNNFTNLPPGMDVMYLAQAYRTFTSGYGDRLHPSDTTYVRRFRYWNQVIPEKLLYLISLGETELKVDNSVEYTWEVYNRVKEEYGFTQYYGPYLA
jgi:hypothetical protein